MYITQFYVFCSYLSHQCKGNNILSCYVLHSRIKDLKCYSSVSLGKLVYLLKSKREL